MSARVIAAINRDLKQLIEKGAFRDDLYYRLNVFPIADPPLRERKDDIPRLASAFASRFAAKMGRAINLLSEAGVRRLKAYDWPGNVRELENIIERAVITSQDGNVNLDRALPESLPAAGSGDAARREEPSKVRTVQELGE